MLDPLTATMLVAQPAAPAPMALPLSARTVFLDLNGVRAVTGHSDRKILNMIDRGKLLWVFNLATNKGGRQQCLRFWVREVVNPQAWRRASLEDVIGQILPVSRSTIRGNEIRDWFMVGHASIHRLAALMGGEVRNGTYRVDRARAAEFLRSRWVGPGIVFNASNGNSAVAPPPRKQKRREGGY